MPTLYVVAGPNGCGKSTLTRTGWLRDLDIIDPDAIARTAAFAMLAAAAREALRRRRAALRAGRTHVLETTLAGSGVFRHMEATRAAGLRVELHYVCVKLPELALDRIRTRVAAGGHHVPETDVRRRLVRSQANLPAAIVRSDEVRLYDNTDPDRPHREVAVMTDGMRWAAEDLPGWAQAAIARPL